LDITVKIVTPTFGSLEDNGIILFLSFLPSLSDNQRLLLAYVNFQFNFNNTRVIAVSEECILLFILRRLAGYAEHPPCHRGCGDFSADFFGQPFVCKIQPA